MSAPAEKKPPAEVKPSLGEVAPLTTPERLAGSTKAHARAVRRARSRRMALRLALFVVLPTALAGIYYGLFASKQYESHAVFTVQSSEMRPTLGVEGLLAGVVSGNGSHDALAVRDYVLSRDMLARLDKEHGCIAHYKNQREDWFSRLQASASFEDAYEYFGHKVSVDYDQSTGAITLRVRAFSSEKAVELSRSIMAYSEEMVNKLSERERRDGTKYAEADVKKAEERLSLARGKIVALQQKHADFNPLQSAAGAMEVRTHLEGEVAKARAELMQLKSFMKEDAPQVLAAAERARSLSAQVSGESRRLVDPTKGAGISSSFADFEAAMVEKEFSQKAYESALASLELARSNADRQHRYLAVIASPSRPDASTYPRRLRSVVSAFFLSFLLLGVVSLLSAAVREHARL
jgi:capsular polysaccharide transport system permease protein